MAFTGILDRPCFPAIEMAGYRIVHAYGIGMETFINPDLNPE
ncbi:hypothetical protein [uncultured Algoriphagus sp.]|tara:strand:- start:129252 stop:129377 length:126 start_codon:yes stop_codon:yes gene_type:complete